MNIDDLIAIDTHVHAEVSCCQAHDAFGEEFDRAADQYFGSDRRPSITETVAYYRAFPAHRARPLAQGFRRRRLQTRGQPLILKDNARLLGLR